MKNRVYLQLTQACNLRCKMCDFWKNDKEKFSENHFFNLIDILVDSWVKWITFWWWEPFLNPQIYDLIKYSKEKWLTTEIITNWVLINKIKISEVIKFLDNIIFSIDSWIPFVHETIRWRKNIFTSIISNLEHIVNLRDSIHPRLNINIDVTLQKDNYNNFETILEIVKKFHLKINFDPVQVIWYWNQKDWKWLLLSDEEVIKLEKKLFDLKKNNPVYVIQSLDSIKRIIFYFKWYKIENFCRSLNMDILVDSYWDVFKCWWKWEKMYNLFKEKKIINNKYKMDQTCYSCWFTHVREDDYFDWYSVTNDLFADYIYN